MKADNLTIQEVFSSGGDIQYNLPIFQREYAWEKEHWQVLLKDVRETYDNFIASDKDVPEHFMGALVVIPEVDKKGTFQAFTLVDGQQRLTSISLLICALRDSVGADNPLHRKIVRYLVNDETGEAYRYKIIPTEKNTDQETYMAILNGERVRGSKSRICEAYDYFLTETNKLVSKNEIDPEKYLTCILRSLHVVYIKLNINERPYKIFESLNAKGKGLTQADLVRNYIAMRLPREQQKKVFDLYWSKIEEMLPERRKTARIPELTAFLRHYLSQLNGTLPRIDHVYNRFRDRMESDTRQSDDAFTREIKTLHRFAEYYDKLLRPDNEPDVQIRNQLRNLNYLDITASYPLLLTYYDLYSRRELDADEFIDCLQVIENYLVRRYLAGEPTGFLAKMFSSLAREINNQRQRDASALKTELLKRNYPSDNRLEQRIITNQVYKSRDSQRLAFVLQSLNQYLSHGTGGYTVLDDAPTIEHIMPRKINADWRRNLGVNWQENHNEFLNTIGNLTIITQKWNAELSNSAFKQKSSLLRINALRLNSDYFKDIYVWNVSEITARTAWLTELILKVWPALGSAPRSEGVTGKKPLTLTIRDKRFPVYSWQGMVMEMVNCLHDMRLLTDINDANGEFKSWIQSDVDDNNFRYTKSSRGWWIQVNMSAESLVDFCERLADYCGLRDQEWHFTYE